VGALLPRRFGDHIVECKLPNGEQRVQIFRRLTARKPFLASRYAEEYDLLAREAYGLTAAHLHRLATDATLLVRSCLPPSAAPTVPNSAIEPGEGEAVVTPAHIAAALADIRPSSSWFVAKPQQKLRLDDLVGIDSATIRTLKVRLSPNTWVTIDHSNTNTGRWQWGCQMGRGPEL
jgi:SpoVK/Ycf46/Vps4 family AAA+-type ATPase